MNRNISDKDKKDWEKFISGNEKISDKDVKIQKSNYPEKKSIDLHGYTLEQANRAVYNFIEKSHKKGIKKLIIVTGKGLHSQNEKDPFVSKDLSILKYSVPHYIKSCPELLTKISDLKEADVKDGGAGAFYIYLKKK